MTTNVNDPAVLVNTPTLTVNGETWAAFTVDVGPTAALSTSAVSALATANASASTAGSSAIATYTFGWGDGSGYTGPQAGATATHVYSAAGTYTVTVLVTDVRSNASVASGSVTTGVSVASPIDISYITASFIPDVAQVGALAGIVGNSGSYAPDISLVGSP